MAQLAESTTNYLRDFTGGDLDAPIVGPEWLRTIRAAARAGFAERGFPTRRDEEWRYTPVSSIIETVFKLADELAVVTAEQIAPYSLTETECTQLVFVNGVFTPHLSTLAELPAGVRIGSLADAVADGDAEVKAHLAQYATTDNPFVALNTAVMGDGAFVLLPRNSVVEQPIHLLFVGTATDGPIVAHPRTLVLAGENTQATIVESYVGPTDSFPEGVSASEPLPIDAGDRSARKDSIYLTNAVTEFVCAKSSVIDHYKVQRESATAFHVATMQVQLNGACTFSSHSISLGGSLVRNDINAVLAAENIECTLNGFYMARDRQFVDNHTSIDHAMPHCNSHEVYKGIIDGHGRGVFNGKIFVRQDAQKTDAKQTNQTLLLSDDAQINTKPQLEIYADDVRCTHGATVGQLSDEALFYLRTRGIDKDTARNLLTYAFASDIVSRIKVEPIRAQLDHVLLSERALEGIE